MKISFGGIVGSGVDAKPPRIAFASAQILLSSVFVRLLSLVTMPVLTRLLPPDAYGTAAMATTLAGFASVTALAGADMSYLRASGAREYFSADQVETFLWRFVVAAAALAALVTYAVASYASRGLDWPEYCSVLIAASAAASMMQTMAQARTRLQGRHTELSAAIAASGVIAAGVCIAVAWFVHDALPLVLSMLIGYASNVVLLRPPFARTLTRPLMLTAAQRREILAIGLPGTITALAFWVLSSADRWFLGQLSDAHTVGLYSIGCSIGTIGMVVNSAIFTVWTPEAIRLGGAPETRNLDELALISEQLFASMAFVTCCVAAGGGDLIALLAAPAFHDARIVVPVIAGGIFCYGIFHLANTIFLIEKKLHRTILWWCAGAALSIALNYALIPQVGMLGSAYAFLLSTCFIAVTLTIVANRLLPVPVHWVRAASIIAATAGISVALSPAWSAAPLSSLILKMPFLAAFAFVLLLTYFAGLRSRLSHIISGLSNRAR